MNDVYDAVIVGGGITGCILAQKLMKSTKKIALIEKKNTLGGRLVPSEHSHPMGFQWFHPKDAQKMSEFWKWGDELHQKSLIPIFREGNKTVDIHCKGLLEKFLIPIYGKPLESSDFYEDLKQPTLGAFDVSAKLKDHLSDLKMYFGYELLGFEEKEGFYQLKDKDLLEIKTKALFFTDMGVFKFPDVIPSNFQRVYHKTQALSAVLVSFENVSVSFKEKFYEKGSPGSQRIFFLEQEFQMIIDENKIQCLKFMEEENFQSKARIRDVLSKMRKSLRLSLEEWKSANVTLIPVAYTQDLSHKKISFTDVSLKLPHTYLCGDHFNFKTSPIDNIFQSVELAVERWHAS